jgi:hypothetical protein
LFIVIKKTIMAEQPLDDHLYHDLLDEILFRDPPRVLRHMDISNGMSKRKQVITFADGSQLMIAAQVPFPPLADMTPTRIFYVKPNGENGEKWDDGSNEAMDLSGQSIAMRMVEIFSQILDSMPEREKVACTACNGNGRCICCNGKGCLNCKGNGRCPSCGGRGLVPKD